MLNEGSKALCSGWLTADAGIMVRALTMFQCCKRRLRPALQTVSLHPLAPTRGCLETRKVLLKLFSRCKQAIWRRPLGTCMAMMVLKTRYLPVRPAVIIPFIIPSVALQSHDFPLGHFFPICLSPVDLFGNKTSLAQSFSCIKSRAPSFARCEYH